MLDEASFSRLADDTLGQVLRIFDAIDPDEAEVDSEGGVISITFGSGVRVVLNTQRPARQLWLAGAGRAYHFEWTAETWRDTRTAKDLFEVLATYARDAGVTLPRPTSPA